LSAEDSIFQTMRTKSRILLRLNILFTIIVLVIGASIINILFSKDFQTGLKEGFSQSYNYNRHPTAIYAEIPIRRTPGQFNIPITSARDTGIHFSARITQIDLQTQGNISPAYSIGVNLLVFICILCYLTIIVILFTILLSLRKSVIKGNVFNRNNIAFMRIIGILLITSTLLYQLARYLEFTNVKDLLKGSNWQVVCPEFNFQEIITGLLILFIAEIFTIGYDITEEQKLTI